MYFRLHLHDLNCRAQAGLPLSWTRSFLKLGFLILFVATRTSAPAPHQQYSSWGHSNPWRHAVGSGPPAQSWLNPYRKKKIHLPTPSKTKSPENEEDLGLTICIQDNGEFTAFPETIDIHLHWSREAKGSASRRFFQNKGTAWPTGHLNPHHLPKTAFSYKLKVFPASASPSDVYIPLWESGRAPSYIHESRMV